MAREKIGDWIWNNRRFHHFVRNIGVAFYSEERRRTRETPVRQLTFSLIEVFNGLIDSLTFFSR